MEFAFDAGYPTRYYLLGSNVILAAGNKIPQSLTDQLAKVVGVSNPDREVKADDTGMYYGGSHRKLEWLQRWRSLYPRHQYDPKSV